MHVKYRFLFKLFKIDYMVFKIISIFNHVVSVKELASQVPLISSR